MGNCVIMVYAYFKNISSNSEVVVGTLSSNVDYEGILLIDKLQ